MLKYTLFLLSLIFSTFTLAQDEASTPAVARSLNSLQFNLGGLFYVHERALNDELALHFEAGLHGTGYSSRNDENASNDYFALRPILIIEPRAYYNLAKRARKGKTTSNNSGNFIGVAFDYQPDVQLLSTNPSFAPKTTFSFTPRWGIRRQLGQHFDFEFTLGLRSIYFKEPGEPGLRFARRHSPSVGLRFGYRF